ncbi:MAG: bifunctional tRNA (5-methylaminomethyl-2-thiouridine)(34)-methyltransferase MnmD/FAD-dependent 5-carboxymethylaminomethyl-2-thiouridine(34) oxidoreductase MnmC [Gammaproteobacteria bacterium]|nr:bifunctional tRNA (5-methylaminomethyl-2-thiouridine)(34)-methyltransferase MnmD/FAD-dependent 5-carboxymethylaminomethyl-2-thiouridine(34) oxidoreductase MnmC [Gammaproteobacteria bacterium]MDP6732019.1 bifunctional tRNA (5-methylaminomethyl-2-thiouridine)(34)-methyltransferase MnmD/FAD-dependent 5-carboxymethylaminomethyl-2-thiouridine(34) oxidoreductase MnmC [Gammaproteobacteria bacterium]
MKIKHASLRWIESDLPYSRQFGDLYYSREDELGESRHAFLEANELRHRWQQAADSKLSFTIAEIGFGSALNFLLTWQLWRSSTHKPAGLHYIAFEKYPFSSSDLKRVQQRWPVLTDFSRALQAVYPDQCSGCHRLLLEDGLILDLHLGDARTQLQNHATADGQVDAWYLDGFNPQLNPELWQRKLFQLIAAASKPAATLSTYSAAGAVRRQLQAVGFEVEKTSGFGRKRHMLVATRPTAIKHGDQQPGAIEGSGSWSIYPGLLAGERQALIIGAGLAGCSMAYSLARRGWRVSVIDGAATPASGASGTAQLALRCRLFQNDSPLSRFFLQAYLFSRRQYSQLNLSSPLAFHDCGVLQLHGAMNKQQPLDWQKMRRLYPHEVIQMLAPADASQLANTTLEDAAYYFPGGGWLDPTLLCCSYLDHPNISLHTGRAVHTLEVRDSRWQAADAEGQLLASATVAVIANSYDATRFSTTAWLPLQTVRGQTTTIGSSRLSASLASVVCGERTVFPCIDGHHTLSASYRSRDSDLSISDADNQQNLQGAQACFREVNYLDKEFQEARVALRCSSSDYLPVVGQVPEVGAMQEQFSALRHNARARVNCSGSYHPGLYLSVAHGSNGLATCPLSSEFLASLINGEVLPIDQAMSAALNPARFIIRDLKKQR